MGNVEGDMIKMANPTDSSVKMIDEILQQNSRILKMNEVLMEYLSKPAWVVDSKGINDGALQDLANAVPGTIISR